MQAVKPVSNQISKLTQLSQFLPKKARNFALSKAFGKIVPFVGTAGLVYEEVTPNKVVVSIKNARHVQNHIKGVHAVAMALIAETATGFVTSLNVPDDRIVLVKSMTVNFKRPSKGDMQAVATLTDDNRQFILDNPKGELLIPCVVTDSTSKEPVQVEMIWAWLPKSELKNKQAK